METFNDTEQQKFHRAQKRVQAISGFYKHLLAYILVNLFLLVIKYINLDGDETFFTFSTFTTAIYWGIGLAFHAIGVFGRHLFFGSNWEERKIREIMEKDRRQKWE